MHTLFLWPQFLKTARHRHNSLRHAPYIIEGTSCKYIMAIYGNIHCTVAHRHVFHRVVWLPACWWDAVLKVTKDVDNQQ